MKIRASETPLILGSVKFLSKETDNFFIVLREYKDEKIVIICNFEETLDIQTDWENGELLLSNHAGRASMNGLYKPFEVAVYKL